MNQDEMWREFEEIKGEMIENIEELNVDLRDSPFWSDAYELTMQDLEDARRLRDLLREIHIFF